MATTFRSAVDQQALRSIPCSLIRGGTSRGAYFHAAHLPDLPDTRDQLLARIMGGPDDLQVDGIGGGHPLTSKVAVVSLSADPEADVDYLFLQVDPRQQTVSDAQNCGNLLAGVGVFALLEGLVAASDPTTQVRVRMLNSGALCHLTMPTPDGRLTLSGTTAIDGVPGTAAAIVCNYLDIAGSSCGAVLPTGRPTDEFDGIAATCIDNGMPSVVMRATDLGITGYEPPATLDANSALKARLESIRRQAGPAMNLGDVTTRSVPKMCLIAPAQRGGLISTRTFIPHVCHQSIGVLGAVTVASACVLANTTATELADAPPGNPRQLAVEHPAGSFIVQLRQDDDGSIAEAGVVRTARALFRGEVILD